MRAWLLAVVALLAAGLRAQTLEDLRQEVRDVSRQSRYSAFVALLSDLAAEEELSGGRFDIAGEPGTDLTVFALPLRRDVDAGGVPMRIEATFGYAVATTRMPDLWNGRLPGLETGIRSRYRAATADAAAGPRLALGSGLTLEPLAHVAASYVENVTYYDGPGAAMGAALLDGILFNWNGVFGGLGGSAALRHATLQRELLSIESVLRLDARRSMGIHATDDSLGQAQTTRWATLRGDFAGPTGWQVGGRSIHWHADLGYRRLLGDTADLLGPEDWFEVGAGLAIDGTGLVPVVSGFDLSGALVFGEGIRGWNVGLSVRF